MSLLDRIRTRFDDWAGFGPAESRSDGERLHSNIRGEGIRGEEGPAGAGPNARPPETGRHSPGLKARPVGTIDDRSPEHRGAAEGGRSRTEVTHRTVDGHDLAVWTNGDDVFAGIADFERSLILDRTSAGRAAAKARGVRFGPPPSLTSEQITHAKQLIDQEGKPVAMVARLLGVHRSTLYRAL